MLLLLLLLPLLLLALRSAPVWAAAAATVAAATSAALKPSSEERLWPFVVQRRFSVASTRDPRGKRIKTLRGVRVHEGLGFGGFSVARSGKSLDYLVRREALKKIEKPKLKRSPRAQL